MIRSLRRRHRWLIVAIGALTAALIVLGLLSRRPVPSVPALDETGSPIESRPTPDGDR